MFAWLRSLLIARRWRAGLRAVAPDPAWARAIEAGDPIEPWWTAEATQGVAGRPPGQPVRALVLHRQDLPGREGPDHLISLVFPWGGRWWVLGIRFGFDTYHWAMSEPEQFRWFNQRLGVGGETVTVVLDDGFDGPSASVYGLDAGYLELTLAMVLALAASADPLERRGWLDVGVDLVRETRADLPAHELRAACTALGVPVDRLPLELARRVRLTPDAAERDLRRLLPVFGDRRHRVFVAD